MLITALAAGLMLAGPAVLPDQNSSVQHSLVKIAAGEDPKGPDPHGADPHGEQHDQTLPARQPDNDQKNRQDPHGGQVPDK